MSELTNSTRKLGFDAAHIPIDLSTNWQVSVVLKVRSYRALALSGAKTFHLNGLEVPQATGFIELIGPRTGTTQTTLLVGFSDALNIPAATFALAGREAVGTLVLPGRYFAPWLEIAKAPNAHFRTGGDGQRNALASDAALLSS